MDTRRLIELSLQAHTEGWDYVKFAMLICEEQKQFDAKLVEDAGQVELAEAIRIL